MKKVTLILVLLAVAMAGSTYGYKRLKDLAMESFQAGVSAANDGYVKCVKNDTSKEDFPEYFNACQSLCRRLYRDNVSCVSSINGGSVTCVCEQTK